MGREQYYINEDNMCIICGDQIDISGLNISQPINTYSPLKIETNHLLEKSYNQDADYDYIEKNIDYFMEKYYNKYVIVREKNILGSYDSVFETFMNLPNNVPIGNYVIFRINNDKTYRLVKIVEEEYSII